MRKTKQDVQMPEGTGLDVVREIGAELMPVTVFGTAFDQYALRAFDARWSWGR